METRLRRHERRIDGTVSPLDGRLKVSPESVAALRERAEAHQKAHRPAPRRPFREVLKSPGAGPPAAAAPQAQPLPSARGRALPAALRHPDEADLYGTGRRARVVLRG